MRALALLVLMSGAFQTHTTAAYDGWISTAKVQDRAAIKAIYGALKDLKIKPGPLARSRAHWLVGVHLADKQKILRALRKRGFAKKVVFSDDPLP